MVPEQKQGRGRAPQRAGQPRADPGDDAFEPDRCLLGAAGERLRRRDVGRGLGIGGEEGCDPIPFIRVEEPIDKTRQVEKTRGLVLGRVGRAGPLPKSALGRPARPFSVCLGSAHHDVLLPYLG